jgi:hypothetical protein
VDAEPHPIFVKILYLWLRMSPGFNGQKFSILYAARSSSIRGFGGKIVGDDGENNGKALGGVNFSRIRLERSCLIVDMVSLQGR